MSGEQGLFSEQGPLSPWIEKAIDDYEDAQNTADAQVNSKAIADAQERATDASNKLKDLFEQVSSDIKRLEEIVQRASDEIQRLKDQENRHKLAYEYNKQVKMLGIVRAKVQRLNDLSIKNPDNEFYAAQAQIAIDEKQKLQEVLKLSEEALGLL